MKKFLKILGWLLVLVLIGAGIYFFKILPTKVDAGMNVVLDHKAYKISDEAKELLAGAEEALEGEVSISGKIAQSSGHLLEVGNKFQPAFGFCRT